MKGVFRIASIVFRFFLLLIDGLIVYANIDARAGSYYVPPLYVIMALMPIALFVVLTVYYNTSTAKAGLKSALQIITLISLLTLMAVQIAFLMYNLPLGKSEWLFWTVLLLFFISSALTFMDVIGWSKN
jgi:hypothetical protein